MPITDQSLKPMATRISRLLSRGAEVSIELGRLVVRQPNGEEVGQDFLEKYSSVLLREILTALGIEAYEYSSYKTGNYSRLRRGGITLQFTSVIADESNYTIFNVGLTRTRTTKSGMKGAPLPKGHFTVTDKLDFYTFWKSTALAIPKSLTSFHDYMGNLIGILFTSNLTRGREDGRMVSSSIRLLSISPEQVRQAFLADNPRITSGYAPDNCRIKPPDKDSAPGYAVRAFQPNSTTCDQYYGKAVIRKSGDKGASTAPFLPKRPQDQTVDEWAFAYCKPED